MIASSLRLAVISKSTVRIFEGKKFLAEYSVHGRLSAEDIETVRTACYKKSENNNA